MLVTRAPGYMLEVEPEAVDLLAVRAARRRGAREPSPRGRASLLREALALWRGPPLAELGEEPFARVEAGRLEELRLAALEERIEADLALGRHAELGRRARDARSRSIRSGSGCAASSCSRCTGRAGRRRRSRPTATRARRSTSSGSSPARRCGSCSSGS